MGTGFWVIQGIFLAATIATAIYAEVERRRDDEAFLRSDSRRVPVERSTDFTIREQARLLLLRGRIREARQGRGGLRDDMPPDGGEPLVLPSSSAADTRQPRTSRMMMRPTLGASRAPSGGEPVPARRSSRWSSGGLILLAGVLLFVVGVGGMWRTNVVMDAVEQAQQQFSPAPRMSFAARVLPGPIASPARYLSAVNGAGGGSGGALDAAQLLSQKQAMDRWEAVLLVGLALLVFSFSRPRVTLAGGGQQTSVAGDLVGFIGLAALVCAGLSFFELPPS